MCTIPRTLTHSDYRLTNMLFGGPPEAREITVVDWQRVAIARGPVDVAFFAVLSLTPELRRAWERELVEQYHDALMVEGVRDYSLEDCWRDYRLCAIGPSRITLSFAARPREDMGGAHLARTAADAHHAGVRGDGRPGHGGVHLGRSSAGYSIVVMLRRCPDYCWTSYGSDCSRGRSRVPAAADTPQGQRRREVE